MIAIRGRSRERQRERQTEREKELFLSESSSLRDDLFPSVQETRRKKNDDDDDDLIQFIPRSRDFQMNSAIRLSTLFNEGNTIDLPRGVS